MGEGLSDGSDMQSGPDYGPDQQLKARLKEKALLSSERDHGDTGNGLEVAHIAGGDTVAKIERSNCDQQVGERQSNAPGRALAVDLPGPESDRSRDRMHRDCGHQLADELLPRSLAFGRVGAGCSMRQLKHRDDRQGHVFACGSQGDFGQSLAGVSTFALGCDQDAGIED